MSCGVRLRGRFIGAKKRPWTKKCPAIAKSQYFLMSRDASPPSSCEMSSDLRTNLRYPVAQQVLDTKTPAKTRHKHDSFINGLSKVYVISRCGLHIAK